MTRSQISYQLAAARSAVAALAATTLLAATLAVTSPAVADTTSALVIDTSTVLRPVTHVGSGGLYALATATTPDLAALRPLHLNQLTQPAPGVQQLGNGATVPTGDALVVSGTATGAGAQQTVRMPDIYPNFPYGWVSWNDWLSKVDTMVKARIAATTTTNINGWELWNEPNWTWNTAAAGPFNDGWTRTYNEVRSLDTVTPIVGPSIDHWDPEYMRSFLTAAKAAGTLPDVVSWHELLNSWTDIPAHVAAYRALESSLGISPRPISINEYAWTNEVDVPGSVLHYLAQFERAGVRDAERAYWYESGTVNGLLYNGQPTGTYWLYDWYGGQTGNIVNVTASGGQDGVAAVDSTRKIVDAVIGGAAGNNTVAVTNLAGFGTTARVSLDYTPNSGRMTNVAAPTHLWTRTYPIANGTVTVPVAGQDANGAYHLVVTPQNGPTTTYQQRYEAENATVVNATRATATNASNGGYVTGLVNSGDARSDSYIDFTVNAPVTGDYDLGVQYANAAATAATLGMRVDNNAWQTLNLPSTGGATNFAAVSSGPAVHLTQGYHVIRLAKGSPGFAGGVGTAAVDNITLISHTSVPAAPIPPDAPVATFVNRVEAEAGTVTAGIIYPSTKASGGKFVGGLDSPNSAVTSTITVPIAGSYTLAVGYANGGGFTQNGTSDAVLGLTINGGTPTDQRFPITGLWGVPGGAFPAKTITVTLNAGSNTVTVAHKANQNYAELDYLQVSSPAGTFVDGRTTQTITFPTLAGLTVGGSDVPLRATASSGLPVSYTANGGCTIVGGAVHAVTPGSCTVTADQRGDSTYDPALPSAQTTTVKAAAAPTAVITMSPAGGANAAGWYRHPATVTVAPPAGNAATAQYRLDGGPWITATRAVTIARDGEHSVSGRLMSTPFTPITGSGTHATIRIDTTAPIATVFADDGVVGSPRNPVHLMWDGYDALSGVAAMSVAVDGGAPSRVSAGGTLTLASIGAHSVVLTVVDTAGNAASTTAAVRITADPPTTATAPASAVAGGFISLHVAGFLRYETVTLSMGQILLGTVTAGTDGATTFVAPLPPAITPGQYTVTATGSTSTLSARSRPIVVR